MSPKRKERKAKQRGEQNYTDQGGSNDNVPNHLSNCPSSMGISFCIRSLNDKNPEISIQIECGIYKGEETETYEKEEEEEEEEERENTDSSADQEKKPEKKTYWRRIPKTIKKKYRFNELTKDIDLGKQEKDPDLNNLVLYSRILVQGGHHLVTIGIL